MARSAAEQEKVIAIARSWLRTPYHPNARRRGAGRGHGVDCAQFLIAVYHEAGLIPDHDPGHYSVEAHLHQADPTYLNTILEYAEEISEAEAQPGDLVLYHRGYGWGHGAIIVRWPEVIIHALNSCGVAESHGTKEGFLQRRPRRFFRLK